MEFPVTCFVSFDMIRTMALFALFHNFYLFTCTYHGYEWTTVSGTYTLYVSSYT